ncbi:MAG: GntP family permease [Blautia sp.]|nr:GntP family permease [Blautia sp.]
MGTNLPLSILGLVIAIAVLMFLAYKGWNIILYSAISTVIVCLFCGINVWDGLKNSWAAGTGTYVATWLMLFAEGSIFGKIYQDTGAATAIADFLGKIFGESNPVIPILIASYLLTMSGISSFVLIFCVYPIAIQLFAKANISKRLLPAVFCYSVWTVATVSPGSAQAPNLIPMAALGTSSMAGAVPGFVFAGIVAVINTLYINYNAKKLSAAGIVFEDKKIQNAAIHENLPHIGLAILPIAVIIFSFNLFHLSAEAALLLGIALSIVLFFKKLSVEQWIHAWGEGAETSVMVLVNTAVIVGFGAVVLRTPVYDAALNFVSNTRINPYLLAAIAANVFSLILGSATSSINLTMQTLGNVFLEYGAQGYNVGFMHRILSQAAMGLDTLPHSGALLAVFNVCGTNHKDAYKYVCFCTVICPVAVSFLIQVPLCMLLTSLGIA